MARKTSFYYSFLVLPAEQRQAIVAVWDFCRAVDDAVDESPPGNEVAGREAVRFWRTRYTMLAIPQTNPKSRNEIADGR